MHEYRYVEYLDDGHHSYQCLTCKKYLPAAGNYCMQCGVKFAGQADCRPRECPAWAWRLWGTGWSDHYYNHCRRRAPMLHDSGWMLEKRRLVEGQPAERWEQEGYYHRCTALQFYESVRDEMTGSIFDDWVYEYRFVRESVGVKRYGPVYRREYRPL